MQTQSGEPTYDEFFVQGTLWEQARTRNPYTFRQTYHLLREALGYQSHYVNYGYWTEGADTVEPGRKLAMLVGERLGLQPGQKLIEAGSGLGQAAVDLAEHYQLAAVHGINICVPQVNFANALARARGLGDKVQHEIGDAREVTAGLKGFDHALALECIGHFPDGDAFLRTVHDVLPAGGKVAFTLVTSPNPPGKVVAGLEDLFFGVVPQSGREWEERLTRCGFVNVTREDITPLVLKPMIAKARASMATNSGAGSLSASQRLLVRAFLRASANAVERGRMGYELLTGTVPSK